MRRIPRFLRRRRVLIALLVLVVVGAGGVAVWARGAPDADAEPTSAAVVTTPEPTTPPASDITDLAGSGSDSTGSGGLGVIPDETAPVEETPDASPSDDESTDETTDETDDETPVDEARDCRTTKYIPTEPMVFEQSGSRVKIWRAYGYGWRINYRVDNGTTYWVDVRKGIENGETPGIYGTSVSEGDFTFSIAQNFGTGIWNGKVNLKGQYRMKMTVCGDWSYTEGFTNVW